MKILLIVGSIIVPLLMFVTQVFWTKLRSVFTIAAIIAALIAGNIASVSIYQVIIDNEVFMTTIHGLFLNPVFIITLSYVGVYALYLLFLLCLKELRGRVD